MTAGSDGPAGAAYPPPVGRRLHNDDWGLVSNCFVCEQTNESGLRIAFYADDGAGRVRARFRLDEAFSGAPRFVHGGVTLAILDEAQAWATIALAGRFAVTTETTSRFRRPVVVDRPHDVTAWLVETGEQRIRTAAEVRDGDDQVCASTTATFTVLSEAVARTAAGADLTGEVRDHLR